MYILDLNDALNSIGNAIKQAIRTFFGDLSAIIYDFIADLYKIFIYISRAEILENEYVKEIYSKVGMILGIFMIFKLSFALIQHLVNPETINDSKKGASKIAIRCVISIVLLGVTPGIFKEAMKLQNLVVGNNNSDNVIYKLIVGKNLKGNFKTLGRSLASDLFFTFYDDPEDNLNEGSEKKYLPAGTIVSSIYEPSGINNIKNTILNGCGGDGCSFKITVDFLALRKPGETEYDREYIIEFNYIFSVGIGLIVAYLFISYCIQIATRVIQLAYLQLIAPVPILSYIGDPDGTFKNWTGQCVRTYLDLFIRLAIIYFVMTVITDITEAFRAAAAGEEGTGIIFSSTGLTPDDPVFKFVKIFLIIGLLMFAKKVPELIKDLFPSMGKGAGGFSFGLAKPKDIPGYGLAKGAATFGTGLAVGGIAGMASGLRHGEGIKGKLAGMTGGFFRGAASARTKGNIIGNAKKGMANVRAANARAYERHHDGSTFFGRMAPVHAERMSAKLEGELEAYKNYASAADIVEKELEKNENVQAAIAAKEALMNRVNIGGPLPTATEIKDADTRINTYKQTALQLEMNKITSKAADKNSTLEYALKNAEEIKRKGIQKGYKGFSNSDDVTSYSDAFFENKKSTKKETNNITSVSGERNLEYSRAKANAKYKHKDK